MNLLWALNTLAVDCADREMPVGVVKCASVNRPGVWERVSEALTVSAARNGPPGTVDWGVGTVGGGRPRLCSWVVG